MISRADDRRCWGTPEKGQDAEDVLLNYLISIEDVNAARGDSGGVAHVLRAVILQTRAAPLCGALLDR
jgi:hypothetical protein